MVDQNSQFYAILTNVGAAKQANADALGIPWTITHMGVGDANGTDPTPNATQTKLINEWRRAPLNQLKVDDKNSAIIVAEQVIPAEVGGKWIREIGLYDANGDMVAVANCAPTYKPLLSQGSGRTQVVRMSLVVSSASNVQLKIDPAVVLATREWVTEELARQDFKHSVLVATTTGINLTGLQTIDGVALTAGARVLVKNQVSAKENGIYTVVAGAWKRAPDADSSAKVTPGLLVLVESGTVNGDSAWQLVTDAPITLGVTALSFDMAFGRTGIAVGTYRSVQVDKYGRVVAATNPTTASGYGLTDVYTKSETYNRSEIAKAILDAVTSAVNGLVDSAPGALDTLKELAAAIGNDPNFATSMVNELAKKAPLLSPKFTGAPEAPTPSASSTGLQVANMSALATAIAASSRQFKTAVIGLSTNTTLTAAQMGNAVQFNSGALTLTLPALADVGNGASVMLRNPSATATQTIVVASSGSIVDGGSTSGSLALKPFEWAELASSGSAWFVVGRGKLKEVAQIGRAFEGSGADRLAVVQRIAHRADARCNRRLQWFGDDVGRALHLGLLRAGLYGAWQRLARLGCRRGEGSYRRVTTTTRRPSRPTATSRSCSAWCSLATRASRSATSPTRIGSWGVPAIRTGPGAIQWSSPGKTARPSPARPRRPPSRSVTIPTGWPPWPRCSRR